MLIFHHSQYSTSGQASFP